MKKFFGCMLILTVIFACCFFVPTKKVYADTLTEDEISIKTYFSEFIETCPNRVAFAVGERSAADFIAQKFETIGLQAYYDSFIKDIEIYENTATQNVLGVLPAENSIGTVLVGAHMDNYDIVGNTGASDNGSGIAVLLALANKMKTVSFNFDVIFAAFGAEEEGLIGSGAVAAELSETEIKDILLYINLDSIACGDYVYAYAQDRPTEYCNYFVDRANRNANFKQIKHAARGLGVTTFVASGSKPYYARYFSTDCLSFAALGVPTLSFFAGNLEYSYGYTESMDESKRLMHTANDNLEYINDSYGEIYIQNMTSVFNCVFLGLTDNAFCEIALGARSEVVSQIWYSAVLPAVVAVAIVVCFVLWSVFYYKKLRILAAVSDEGVKNFRIFSQPNDEEIFTFSN